MAMGRVFLTLLLQIKSTSPDNPNNVGLTFSPKKQPPQVGRKPIKLTENCKKACVAVLLRLINVMIALYGITNHWNAKLSKLLKIEKYFTIR